jgi:hypothetical protein
MQSGKQNRREEEKHMVTTVAAVDTAVDTKRLNVNLSGTAFLQVQVLAKQTRCSMTELVRIGLGLLRVAIEETAKGNKLHVVSKDGTPLKELVLPEF